MAYPTVSAPYGLIPINLVGGRVFAGATRQIPIASGEGTSIFYGDVVAFNTDGNLTRDVSTDAATPIGVFLGCSYTDPTFGKVFRQYYPAGTVASDTVGIVCDDPDALFKAAVVSSSTTISYMGRTDVNRNATLVQNNGSTVTGNSAVGIQSTTGTATTLPVRIVDFVPETAIAGEPGSYTEVIVKWVAGVHRYTNPTGV
jgi:hypothetical protein